MRHNQARTLAAAVSFTLVVTGSSACFSPDVDAITAKMRDECSLAPDGPQCAWEGGVDDAPARRSYENFVQRHVTEPGTEACLLDVSCAAGDGFETRAAAVHACLADDGDDVVNVPGCRTRCDDELRACGGEGACSAADVDACYAAWDSCRAALSCP